MSINGSTVSLGQPGNASANDTMAGTQTAAPIPEYGWGGYLQGVGLMFALLAALLVAFVLFKRYAARAGLGGLTKGSLKLEAQLGLGAKKSVVVVRFLNTRLVLGVTDTQINLLTRMDHDDASPAQDDYRPPPAKRSRSS